MRFKLSPKGVKLAEEFEYLFGDKECTCQEENDGNYDEDWQVCNYCLHPGNPANIQEDDSNITNILISKQDVFESPQCSHVWGYTNAPCILITSIEQFKDLIEMLTLENIIPFPYCPYCGIKLPKVSV
jgi:hypothetical protein